MGPLVPLAALGAAAFFLFRQSKGAVVKPKGQPVPNIHPPPEPAPPQVVVHPTIGPIVVPPSPIPSPPNTVIPSPLGNLQDPQSGPANQVIINPTNPVTGNPNLGTVVTKSAGAQGRLFVHSAMDTTTGSRIGTLEHAEVVRLLSTQISPHMPALQGDLSWYHVQKLDGSLDGFADAAFISEDINGPTQ
jgi:hypothetical protein